MMGEKRKSGYMFFVKIFVVLFILPDFFNPNINIFLSSCLGSSFFEKIVIGWTSLHHKDC